jgi:hypothetical protein
MVSHEIRLIFSSNLLHIQRRAVTQMSETKLTTENVGSLAEKPKKILRRNRRALVFLKLPIISVSALIWLFGWTLTCLGSKQKTVKAKVSEKSEITFAVIAPQQTCVMQSDFHSHINRGKKD